MPRLVMTSELLQILKNIQSVLHEYQGNNAVLSDLSRAISDFNMYFAPVTPDAVAGYMAQGYQEARWPPAAGKTC